MLQTREPGAPRREIRPTWLLILCRDHPWLIAVAVLIIALAVVVALIWPVTDLIAAHDVGLIAGAKRAPALQSARASVRTQLLTLGAGVFAAGALVYTARNFALSRGTLEQTRRTVELTELGQMTDRYAKAVEQLGSAEMDVRIGGIYGLERVASDSRKDHPAVMAVLTTFVREHSGEQWPVPKPGAPIPNRTVRPDIQAALTVIGRRVTAYDVVPIDLSAAKLRCADLAAADLRQADLSFVDLRASLLTDADLSGALLLGTDLTGSTAIQTNFIDAKLAAANFAEADLTGANFANVHLARASFSGAILRDANLNGADLAGMDLTTVVISDSDASGANLTNVAWPSSTEVPGSWRLDDDTGRLERYDVP